ncbi:MAG: hypothetical protein ACTHNK_14970 [Thermomicrobiales bacterium]
MTTTMARPTEAQQRGFSREAVEALSRAKGEPEWVLAARLRAWEIYEATPMPSLREEEWRRTSIRMLKLDQQEPFSVIIPPATSLADVPEAARAGLSEAGRAGLLVQHNSTTVYHTLDAALAAKGVIFTGLDEAVREHPDLLQRYLLTEAVPAEHDKFSALHAAFWSGGSFL